MADRLFKSAVVVSALWAAGLVVFGIVEINPPRLETSPVGVYMRDDFGYVHAMPSNEDVAQARASGWSVTPRSVYAASIASEVDFSHRQWFMLLGLAFAPLAVLIGARRWLRWLRAGK